VTAQSFVNPAPGDTVDIKVASQERGQPVFMPEAGVTIYVDKDGQLVGTVGFVYGYTEENNIQTWHFTRLTNGGPLPTGTSVPAQTAILETVGQSCITYLRTLK
jgi:hypothetical protein